jgi:hypothetical protein
VTAAAVMLGYVAFMEHAGRAGAGSGPVDRPGAAPGAGAAAARPSRICPGAEQVRAGHRDPELGQHRVDLVLALAAQPDQLVPVPGQLPQVRISWGVIHASGSRPIRSRSARLAASLAPVLTR